MYNYEDFNMNHNMKNKQGYRHGMRYTKLYRVWAGIISRTRYSGDTNYKRYGGRGIVVCAAWRTFMGFYKDMGSGYREGLQIDRIDNDGNYEPGNCRWVTQSENCNNKRQNHRITWKGITKTLTEWSKIIGMNRDTLRHRIKTYGYSIDEAFTRRLQHE